MFWLATLIVAIWSRRPRLPSLPLREFRETIMAPYRREATNSSQEQKEPDTAVEVSSGRLIYDTVATLEEEETRGGRLYDPRDFVVTGGHLDARDQHSKVRV